MPFFVLVQVQDVTSTIISPEPEPDSNNGLFELWLLWHWFACIAPYSPVILLRSWWENYVAVGQRGARLQFEPPPQVIHKSCAIKRPGQQGCSAFCIYGSATLKREQVV